MSGSTDVLAHSCAMIQYQVVADKTLDFACRQNHVCFQIENGAGGDEGPVPKRRKIGHESLLAASTNALIASKFKKEGAAYRIAGICASEPIMSAADMRDFPNMARRTTVQASGVATLHVAQALDKNIRIGTYIGIDENSLENAAGNTPAYTTLNVVPISPFFKAQHVLGRVCNITNLIHGFVELKVLLTPQLKPQPHVLPNHVTSSEDALFNAYIPPALLHDIWASITPGATEERAAGEHETLALETFKKAAEQARAKNMINIASQLENAIFDSQRSAIDIADFPTVQDMSGVGLHTILIGNAYAKGVLWFFPTLTEVRTAMPLIMRHRAADEWQGGGGGEAAVSMFKTDAEMKAIQSFLAWSKEHADHIQEPELRYVVANLRLAGKRAS